MESFYLVNYDSDSKQEQLLALMQYLAEYLAAQSVYVPYL